MTQQNKSGRLYVVSAPSGAGKTSLTHAVIDRLHAQGRKIRFSVSYTTRQPRAGEKNGVDYYFVNESQFRTMIEAGDFLEYAHVFDRFYGTANSKTQSWLEAGYDVVLDIDWQGAMQVRKQSASSVLIFIKPPDFDALEKRLRARGSESEESLQRRLAQAQQELAQADNYDYCVLNDRFEDALDEMEQIFKQAANH